MHLKDDEYSFYYSIPYAVRFYLKSKKIAVMKFKLRLIFQLIYTQC